jgi:hypothetical protein
MALRSKAEEVSRASGMSAGIVALVVKAKEASGLTGSVGKRGKALKAAVALAGMKSVSLAPRKSLSVTLKQVRS